MNKNKVYIDFLVPVKSLSFNRSNIFIAVMAGTIFEEKNSYLNQNLNLKTLAFCTSAPSKLSMRSML